MEKGSKEVENGGGSSKCHVIVIVLLVVVVLGLTAAVLYFAEFKGNEDETRPGIFMTPPTGVPVAADLLYPSLLPFSAQANASRTLVIASGSMAYTQFSFNSMLEIKFRLTSIGSLSLVAMVKEDKVPTLTDFKKSKTVNALSSRRSRRALLPEEHNVTFVHIAAGRWYFGFLNGAKTEARLNISYIINEPPPNTDTASGNTTIRYTVENKLENATSTFQLFTEVTLTPGYSFEQLMNRAAASNSSFRFTAKHYGGGLGILITEINGVKADPTNSLFWAFLLRKTAGDCLMPVGVSNFNPVPGNHLVLSMSHYDIFNQKPKCIL